MDVVKVVGGDQPQPELPAEAGQRLVDAILPVDAMALHLEQEALFGEDVTKRRHRFARAFEVVLDHPARHLALQAPGESDQPRRMLGQYFLIYAGLVVHPLHLPHRAELREVESPSRFRAKTGEVVRANGGWGTEEGWAGM